MRKRQRESFFPEGRLSQTSHVLAGLGALVEPVPAQAPRLGNRRAYAGNGTENVPPYWIP